MEACGTHTRTETHTHPPQPQHTLSPKAWHFLRAPTLIFPGLSVFHQHKPHPQWGEGKSFITVMHVTTLNMILYGVTYISHLLLDCGKFLFLAYELKVKKSAILWASLLWPPPHQIFMDFHQPQRTALLCTHLHVMYHQLGATDDAPLQFFYFGESSCRLLFSWMTNIL